MIREYRMIVMGALAAIALLSPNARSQIRPTIIDGGEVHTKTQTVTLERRNVGPTRASKAAFGLLVVLTSPKDAAIVINGKSEGKAVDGKFKRELPLGKRYAIAVSAGPDYTEFKEAVELKSREAKFVEAPLTSKYGVITVFPAMDRVRLLLDGQPVPAASMSIDKIENTITIDKIAAGTHKVTYDLPGYELNERNFDVSPGSEIDWKLIPKKAVSDITVVTEPGAALYIDGEEKGTTASDGRLTAPQIYFGTHEVKLAKDGFKQYTQTVTLAKEPIELAARLEPIPTSAEFSDDFEVPNPDKWTMPPAGFSIQFEPQKNGKKNGRLFVEKAPVIGSPTNIVYRDFYMNFDLKLVNGGGAAWAVRIKDPKDPKNYYLFYLSGNDGLYPGRFLTYVIRDGKFDASKPADSNAVPVDLKAGEEYAIHVEGSQNLITTTITPAKTGETINIGAYKDKDTSFPYGGIGFRTVSKEKFSIDDLFVGPPKQK